MAGNQTTRHNRVTGQAVHNTTARVSRLHSLIIRYQANRLIRITGCITGPISKLKLRPCPNRQTPHRDSLQQHLITGNTIVRAKRLLHQQLRWQTLRRASLQLTRITGSKTTVAALKTGPM